MTLPFKGALWTTVISVWEAATPANNAWAGRISKKPCKSRTGEDRHVLPSKGHGACQSCDDSSRNSFTQLNNDCPPSAALVPSTLSAFIWYEYNQGPRTHQVDLFGIKKIKKKAPIYKSGKGLQQVIDGESVPVHNYRSPSDKRSPLHFMPLSLRPHFGAKMDDDTHRSLMQSRHKKRMSVCSVCNAKAHMDI